MTQAINSNSFPKRRQLFKKTVPAVLTKELSLVRLIYPLLHQPTYFNHTKPKGTATIIIISLSVVKTRLLSGFTCNISTYMTGMRCSRLDMTVISLFFSAPPSKVDLETSNSLLS